MEKVKKRAKKPREGRKKREPWRRRMSLKTALVLTTLACLLAGFSVCLLELYVLSTVHNDIYETYVMPYLPNDGKAIVLEFSSPDEKALISQETIPGNYVDPDTGEEIPRSELPSYLLVPAGFFRFIYRHNDLIATFLCFATAMLFFVLDAAWYYRWKIRKPLGVLTVASQKIAENDLDFTIPQPSADELGRLCGSFEKMRGSLEENNKAMWKSMEERRRLNAAFAHDLRTPLTVLQGYSDFLLDGLPAGEITPEKAEETVGTMKRSLTRLQRYVEGMNSLQKLEDVTPSRDEVSFTALCSQLRETAEILRGPEGFSFVSNGDGTLLIDQELVFQVFENLMQNAARYAEKTVEVTAAARKGGLFLTVADDGPGFPAEALKKAADPYYRADKSRESGDETQHFGLGLYICRLLCEKHGGMLLLKNRPEGGASVTAVFQP